MNNHYGKYRPDYELPKVTHILPITNKLSVCIVSILDPVIMLLHEDLTLHPVQGRSYLSSVHQFLQ